MEMFVLLVMGGLQAKHFAADYLLQPGWMIAGKGSFARAGGYAHVGVHALGTLVLLLLAGVPLYPIAALVLGEAVAHYLIDFSKARWSKSHPADVNSRAFWAAQGADQFMHQLTYVVMMFLVLNSIGAT